MKKILFLFLIISLLFGCNQGRHTNDNDDAGENVTPQPKEFTKTIDSVSFKMIRIEGVKKTILGKITVGDVPNKEGERYVTLSPHYIGETEITQELYKAVTDRSLSYFNGASTGTGIPEGETQEKRPVESVNWYEAAFFLQHIN